MSLMGIGPPEADVKQRTIKYAVTLSVHSRLYVHPADKQFDLVKHVIDKFPGKVTAVAELTKKFNVHFHLMVDFEYDRNVKSYPKAIYDYLRQYDKCLGKEKCVKQIDDEPGWVSYMTKDLESTFDLLNRWPVLRDDFQVFQTGKWKLYGIE